MATGTTIGEVEKCNLTRSEDDTDDLTVHLFDDEAKTIDSDVVGWTVTLRVGPNNDDAPLATFTGTGIAGGLLPIEMTTFAVPIGNYKYDIRIIDTVIGDAPARVYFKGSFKVTTRIN